MPEYDIGKGTGKSRTKAHITIPESSTSKIKFAGVAGEATLDVHIEEVQRAVVDLERQLAALKASSPDPKIALLVKEADKVVAVGAKAVSDNKWYSVSAKGVLEAAKAVGEAASPLVGAAIKVIELIAKAQK
jgi:hypothetical protein